MNKGDKPESGDDFDIDEWAKPRRHPAPVINPIPTGNSAAAVNDQKDNRRPNWSKWQNMPHAALWQIVALSLNIEPDQVKHAQYQWLAGSAARRRFEESEEFQGRYDVAVARLAEVQVTMLRMDGRDPDVTLLSFRLLATVCAWSLPSEFPALQIEDAFTPEQREHWRIQDLWSEADLQTLCCGLIPGTTRPATTGLNDAADRIRRAVIVGSLRVASEPIDSTAGDRMYGHSRFFAPIDATLWAEGKFADFPFGEGDFAETTGQSKAASQSRAGWPWGTHETKLLRILSEAVTKWWVNFDPADGSTAPTNEQVIEWLTNDKSVSKRTAEVIASIIRADGLRTGPR